MIPRPILTLCLAATLCAFAAGPAAADCDFDCTPESDCNQRCLGCIEEHIDYGCIRYQWTTCGQRATCNWGSAAPMSRPAFEASLQGDCAAPPPASDSSVPAALEPSQPFLAAAGCSSTYQACLAACGPNISCRNQCYCQYLDCIGSEAPCPE